MIAYFYIVLCSNLWMEIRARRVESPSSINTFNLCPRKYYHTYIEKLPTKGNIHTIKGNVVHSVLENFFNLQVPEDLDYDRAEVWLKQHLFSLFARFWKDKKENIKDLEISEGDEAIGINDCVNMLYLWADQFLQKAKITGLPIREAFKILKPLHKEKYFKSKGLSVQGFVDVIEEKNGKIRLMDYKTSSSSYIGDEYILQLGIYALLYKENFNSTPEEVGIYFLRDINGEKVLKVNDNLLNSAKEQIIKHHSKTVSSDIQDYPKTPGFQCKWATGQCAYYELCFGVKNNVRKNNLNKDSEVNKQILEINPS